MRDRRSKAFRSISRKPFGWAEARVAHLPAERRAAAVQLTTLDLLHRGLLGRLWGRIDPTAGLEVLGEVGRRIGASPDTRIGTLIRLNSCRPAGAKYRRVDDFMGKSSPAAGPQSARGATHGRSSPSTNGSSRARARPRL